MKHLFLFLVQFILSQTLLSQSIVGKWSGESDFENAKSRLKYEIVIKFDTNYFAETYTYFKTGETEYFTICAATVEYDSSKNKISITEKMIIESNYPQANLACLQKHILKLDYKSKIPRLNGHWSAARKNQNCGDGKTILWLQPKEEPFSFFKLININKAFPIPIFEHS